jgi:lipopolysaccharide/colanic/teichoic acid biosynthesis glycosyltransferase/uridine kinase
MHHQSKLIAIVGGSGAGKSWLARHLQRAIGPTAVRLSLDDFYHDRSQLLPAMRLKVNYDHPRAIDWEQLEIKLKACRDGKCVQVPSYDFATHTRRMAVRSLSPGRVVLVDGLWLLLRRGVRPLFDFSIYLNCPTALRLERRIGRDVTERGRQADTARRQFWESVAPVRCAATLHGGHHHRRPADRIGSPGPGGNDPRAPGRKPGFKTAIFGLMPAAAHSARGGNTRSLGKRHHCAPGDFGIRSQRLIMQAIQDYNTMLDHYIATQSATGRWRLKFHVEFQRMVWRWHVIGGQAAKRLLDIVASTIFLLVFSPLYLLIALAIWLEDGRPVFFTQIRVGQFGREFRMYKFRSMCHNAEAKLQELLAKNCHSEGVTFKIKNDPRLTRVGKFLRKYNLDELPQFWNVLLGDMSVVGPRPSPYSENQFCPPWREARLSVRPGITGLWQVRRTRRAGSDFQEWIKYDIEYVENRTWWLDMKIIYKTILTMVRKGTRQ